MTISGTVIKGDGIAAARYGTPTANLAVESLPHGLEPGVYLARATVDGASYHAAVYFNDPTKKFEVHLLDVDMDLLDKMMDVELVEKVSEHVEWESEVQMRAKIADDLKKIRERLSKI